MLTIYSKIALKNFVFLAFLMTSSAALSCIICDNRGVTTNGIPIEKKCVDVGGYSLYVLVNGNKSPTVVFESGLGDSSWSWDKVIPEVSKYTTSISYDRNGLGRSDTKFRESQPRTAQQAVDNLHKVLTELHAKPPYVLVGHSLGGLYMQLFAQEYPKEVSAVVLVDSAMRNQTDFLLPEKDSAYYLEAKGMKESTDQVKKAPPFPPVPLIVLTSAQKGENWVKQQKALLQLSPKSKQIITQDSGHFIQREQPDLVINSLKSLFNVQ